MNGFYHIPRGWLSPKILAENDFLKAAIYLAKKINDEGSAEFSSGDAKSLFDMSPRRYRTFMSLITSGKLTDKQTTNRTTNISFECQAVARTKRQAPRQTSDKLTDKQKQQKFIPPTEQQVVDYVAQNGYHFNPESFIPFYQGKGWKIGDQPMKDWKAACRTWEIRWKEKHGEKFYYQISQQPAPGKANRLEQLEQATRAILQQPGNIDPLIYDKK